MELLLAPSCGPCGGQEVNVDEHTSRPETSAVPASHVLQEILRSDSLLGTTDVPYPRSNVISTDEERFEPLCGYGVSCTDTVPANLLEQELRVRL